MTEIQKLFAPFRSRIRCHEPLSRHTSFRIGGPADVFSQPHTTEELTGLVRLARENGIPVFIIGAGANILVSDKGIRGLVISLERFRKINISGATVTAGAGTAVTLLAEQTARCGLQGLERFYAMPGCVGGSVWMNARCYGTSFCDTLDTVTILDHDLHFVTYRADKTDFDYKKSPFQNHDSVILDATFTLARVKPKILTTVMKEIKRDRMAKGHFQAPSAGSVFKNNRQFGAPTGKLLDTLGMRGKHVGGAMISPVHANIIINKRQATAADVKALVSLAEQAVKRELGFTLERELIYVGEE